MAATKGLLLVGVLRCYGLGAPKTTSYAQVCGGGGGALCVWPGGGGGGRGSRAVLLSSLISPSPFKLGSTGTNHPSKGDWEKPQAACPACWA
jgi:hypothetical protein